MSHRTIVTLVEDVGLMELTVGRGGGREHTGVVSVDRKDTETIPCAVKDDTSYRGLPGAETLTPLPWGEGSTPLLPDTEGRIVWKRTTERHFSHSRVQRSTGHLSGCIVP